MNIDESLEYCDMYNFYEHNADFRRYVDMNRKTYRRKLTDELKSPITREYYRSLQKGGCNEKRENRTKNS